MNFVPDWIQYEANEIEMRKQREEENTRREAFEKRASEIGYANALMEAYEQVHERLRNKLFISGKIS